MKAIIIDDEPRAIDLLKNYLTHFSTIELLATFRNGLKALDYLSKEEVNLVFLDINMPHISGVSLAKILPKSVKIVFTTAHSEYAVESYEIQAVDYLLKPISLERFTRSMSRILSLKESSQDIQTRYVAVKSGFETHRLAVTEIYYLQKDGNYITYFCAHKKVMARETIAEALAKLPSFFVQTHKSFIINRNKVTSYDRNQINMDHIEIPIGESFKKTVKRGLW